MTYDQEQQLVTTALADLRAELPETFGLRAFPGDRFRIAPNWNEFNTSPHFHAEANGGVQVVIQRDCGDRGWLDMGRNTPEFIRAEARR